MVVRLFFAIVLLVLCTECESFERNDLLTPNLLEEPCLLQLAVEPQYATKPIFDLVCADVAVGRLMVHAEQRLVALQKQLQCTSASDDNDQIDSDLETRGAKRRMQLDKGFEELLFCRLQSSGLPHMVARFNWQGRPVIADGPPAIWPTLAVLAGQEPWSDAQRKASVDWLKRVFRSTTPLISARQLGLLSSLRREARSLNQRADYVASEDRLRELLQLQEEILDVSNPSIGETLLDLALDLSNQGRFEEANALLLRAEPLIQRSPGLYFRNRDLGYRALHAANQGMLDQALKYAQAASRAWRNLLSDDNQARVETALAGESIGRRRYLVEWIHALQIEAAMLLRNQQPDLAAETAQTALTLITPGLGYPEIWYADLLMTIGDVAALQQRDGVAESAFARAYTLRERAFGPGLPAAKALLSLGRALHASGSHPRALMYFRRAMQSIRDSSSPTIGSLNAEEVSAFIDSASQLLKQGKLQAIEIAGLLDEIFLVMQSSRAGAVETTIARTSAVLAAGTSRVAMLMREVLDADREHQSLRAILAELQARPDTERDPDREIDLRLKIARAQAQLKAQSELLKAQAPRHAEAINPGTATIASIQNALADNEGLLQVFSARSATHLMLIKRGAVHLHSANIAEENLQNLIQKLRKGLQPDDGGVNEFPLDDAYDLYNALLAGLEKPLSTVKRLNIVVRGALATLPFAVLITDQPQGSGEATEIATDLSWLIRRHSLSYTPSASAWLRLRAEASSSSHADDRMPFFGIGNPHLTGRPDHPSGPNAASRELEMACKPFAPASASLVRGLSALPDTEQEIRSIAAILAPNEQATWLLFDDASEEAVYKAQLERYRILYFATHGLLPGELRCQSEPGLVLTPPSSTPKSRAGDGILQASEIASLRLNADTVVLSACNTAASGGGFGGESLSGLAQSFFFAGARSLLVSHWQVPSRQTALLMIDTFSRLGRDKTLSIALQDAQIQMASSQQTAHPYYWAAFTLIGEK